MLLQPAQRGSQPLCTWVAVLEERRAKEVTGQLSWASTVLRRSLPCELLPQVDALGPRHCCTRILLHAFAKLCLQVPHFSLNLHFPHFLDGLAFSCAESKPPPSGDSHNAVPEPRSWQSSPCQCVPSPLISPLSSSSFLLACFLEVYKYIQCCPI